MKVMAGEEIIVRLNLLEQQAEERRSQIEELDGQRMDMINLKNSLQELDKGSKNQEILANLGRGVFIKAKVEDEKLFVNVGSKTLARKTFKEAVEIIDNQLAEIERIKAELMGNIEEINAQLYKLLEEAQKSQEPSD